MGRNRTANKHLPQRMQVKKGCYYHVVTMAGRQQWTALGSDYGVALQRWAAIEGRVETVPGTVRELLANYITVNTGTLSPETLRGYAQSAARLGKKFGNMRIEDLRREHVYRYVQEDGRVRANRDRALLGAAYTHAANLGWEGVNPAHGHRRRAPEVARKRYVTDAELTSLLEAAAPKPFKRPRPDGRTHGPKTFQLLIRFAYLTGMSEGDICRLQLTASTDDGIRYVRQKTGAEVLIGWSDELKALWKEAAGARIGAQALFRARGGRAYTPDGLRAVWADVRTTAGLPDVRFHDLRRKAASDVEEAHATQLLAHGDGAVTRKHYRAKLTAVKPVR